MSFYQDFFINLLEKFLYVMKNGFLVICIFLELQWHCTLWNLQ